MNLPGYISFNRPACQPRQPSKRNLKLIDPPRPNERGGFQKFLQWGSVIIGVLTLGATAYFAQAGGSGGAIIVLAGISIGLGSFFTAGTLINAGMNSKKEIQRYRDYLVKMSQEISRDNADFVNRLHWIDPEPGALTQVLEQENGRYLWERQPNHADSFMWVRIGVQPNIPGSVNIELPYSVSNSLNPAELDKEIQEFYQRHNSIENVPGLVNLREAEVFGIAGPNALCYELANTILCQLAVHHSPEDVRLALFYSPEKAETWFWAGWLPHTQPLNPEMERPYLSGDTENTNVLIDTIKQLLNARYTNPNSSDRDNSQPKLPYLVALIDELGRNKIDREFLRILLRDGPSRNILTIFLVNNVNDLPSAALAHVTLQPDRNLELVVTNKEGRGNKALWKMDRSQVNTEQLAHRLAPYQLQRDTKGFVLQGSQSLFEVLGWDKLDGQRINKSWQKSSTANLEVTLGQRPDGQPLVINLDESVHGVHGVLAGATGTGKGEFLLTFITSLAINNHPSHLNFVLADFKGGATFQVFKDLPHTVGLATDQIDEFGLFRFLTSLKKELGRRKAILEAAQRKYGARVQKIRDFEAVAPNEVFPFLLVIIDEFAELARTMPDMMDELVVIAEQGRSLGVFLLLSMQSTDLLKSGIEKNLSYRLALRMSKEDSDKLLQDSAASRISKKAKGRAFFRCGDELHEFQTARVMTRSLSMPGSAATASVSETPEVRLISPNWEFISVAKPASVSTRSNPNNPSDMTDVELGVNSCQEAMQYAALPNELFIPWQPTLPDQISVTELLQGVFKEDHFLGWPKNHQPMRVPIGVLDRFWEQAQPVLFSELAQGKHLQFAGVQNSGRISAMLSTVLGLVATHSPEELAFVFIDFGTTLGLFKSVPHQIDHYRPHQLKEIDECIDDLCELLKERRAMFSTLSDGSVANNIYEYRAYQEKTGVPPEDLAQPVVVVIDNYTSWYQSHPDFMFGVLPDFKNLVQNGSAFGIYIILTVDKPADVGSGQLNANFQTVSLRMDPDNLSVVPYNKKILSVWQNRSGRGFVEDTPPYNLVECQCLLPCNVPEAQQLKKLQEVIGEISKQAVNPA